MTSFELLYSLKKLNLLENKHPWWWDNSNIEKCIIGAILTQNTKWENVESSFTNLEKFSDFSLDSILNLDSSILENSIRPSGFFRQKSLRIKQLFNNIQNEFLDIENFSLNVAREWLLAQKGIGFETADSILNYALRREIMVVDKYSYKLLCSLGIEIDNYEDLQNWFMDSSLIDLYENMSLVQIYARYHGKIVEFSKKKLDPKLLLEST